ncbi:hypothetical protein GJ744_006597 [Endocarpon pusillum]|uniref:THIF-type NAD/FAD binding fold domain-containing protein n=1 Tax=Endocarpon pusillum TaxID=364733 RepID=A0A8H7ARE2_9EURO|nr:hypothetical protein GJ744_006597 [Endocarpon pusillum]
MTPSTAHTADKKLTMTSPSSKSLPKASSSSYSSFLVPPHPLSTSRYHRQLLVPSISIRGQEAISKAKVLIIGLGGLGSPACLYLASAGIGTVGLVDADTVELSNLHRQIVHSETAVERGMSKVESAMARLRGINSEIRILGYRMAFEGANGVGIVEGTIQANVLARSEDSGGGGWWWWWWRTGTISYWIARITRRRGI